MKDPNITVKLTELIQLHLGDAHSRPLPRSLTHLAPLIATIAKDTYICYVQFPDSYSEIECPVIWNYARWRESCELYERQKKYSDEQRKARFLFDARVKQLVKPIMKFFLVDEQRASIMAHSWVTKSREQCWKAVGVERLIPTFEEIP